MCSTWNGGRRGGEGLVTSPSTGSLVQEEEFVEIQEGEADAVEGGFGVVLMPGEEGLVEVEELLQFLRAGGALGDELQARADLGA